MGLIKTAMMSGAAMYGVKQISKEAERRHSQQRVAQSQPQYQPQRPAPDVPRRINQDYQYQDGEYEQAPPPPYRRTIANQPAYYEQANFQSGGGYRQQQPQHPYMYEEQEQTPADRFQRQRAGPSRYGQPSSEYYGNQRQQRQSGFVEPYEIEEPQQPSSSTSGSRNALLSQAMQFAQTQGAGLKGGSTQEFISGFLKK